MSNQQPKPGPKPQPQQPPTDAASAIYRHLIANRNKQAPTLRLQDKGKPHDRK